MSMGRSAIFIMFSVFCAAPLWGQAPSTLRSVGYPKGLYFDFSNDTSILNLPEFEYDLTVDKGMSLVMGPVTLNEKTFNFLLGKMGTLLPGTKADDAATEILLIRWPEPLLKQAQLEMISRSGKVIWSHQITAKDLESWKNKVGATKVGSSYRIGILKPSSEGAPFAKTDEGFRFCLTDGSGAQMTRLCSDIYIARKVKNSLVLARQVLKNEIRVLLQNEEAPQKNILAFQRNQTVQFYADLASGMSYEFVSKPPPAYIMDISPTTKPDLYRVLGWDNLPVGRYRIIPREQYGRITQMLGFQATIKDERKFWEAGVKTDNPVMYFPGSDGGIFKQKIDLGNVPPPLARVYLSKDTPDVTYSDSISLKGRKHTEAKVKSEEYSTTESSSAQPPNFVWNFKAETKEEINKSYLLTTYEGKTYKNYFEVYRASANELSGRLTGLSANGAIRIVAELAYNRWFETLMGLDSYWLSQKRWGASVKYFKSLNNLPVDNSGGTAPVDILVADLKYRASPGVWTRDETVGAIASYQTITFGESKAPMMGVGAFWARSMPAVFDKWFNYLPYMNYPKWVDMEFIYYGSSLKNDVKLKSSYSLNFHGQVLWTKDFFGEAGFGMKRYAFLDESVGRAGRDLTLITLYGTVGLGLKF